MFEEDYIMRIIKEMARVVLRLVFNIDSTSPTIELLENQEERKILEELIDLAEMGNINEAENRLYDLESDKIAIFFYSFLNDKTDEFLEENEFSREEVEQGITEIARKYGLEK